MTQPSAVQILAAEPGDAARLTEIAFAAKRHWAYPENWIEQWRDLLTITPEYVRANPTFKSVGRGGSTIVGFSAVRIDPHGILWVDHVWVLPTVMGRGIGRRLFEACEAEARRAGARRLRIEADPHAEEFYARMGARTIAREPAFMDGVERHLPLMEKVLA